MRHPPGTNLRNTIHNGSMAASSKCTQYSWTAKRAHHITACERWCIIKTQLQYGWDISEGTRKQLTVPQDMDMHPCYKRQRHSNNQEQTQPLCNSLVYTRLTLVPSEVFSNHASKFVAVWLTEFLLLRCISLFFERCIIRAPTVPWEEGWASTAWHVHCNTFSVYRIWNSQQHSSLSHCQEMPCGLVVTSSPCQQQHDSYMQTHVLKDDAVLQNGVQLRHKTEGFLHESGGFFRELISGRLLAKSVEFACTWASTKLRSFTNGS